MMYTLLEKEVAREAPEKDFYARQAERYARRSMVAERESRRQAFIEQACLAVLGAVCFYCLLFYSAL